MTSRRWCEDRDTPLFIYTLYKYEYTNPLPNSWVPATVTAGLPVQTARECTKVPEPSNIPSLAISPSKQPNEDRYPCSTVPCDPVMAFAHTLFSERVLVGKRYLLPYAGTSMSSPQDGHPATSLSRNPTLPVSGKACELNNAASTTITKWSLSW